MFLLDVGNSALKWAVLERGALTKHGRCRYDLRELQAQLDASWGAVAKPPAAFVVSVGAPKVSKVVAEWMERHWGITPHFIVSSAERLGIRNAYVEPERLGADRWVGMIAAYHKVGAAVCVVDCGTAITIDAVSAKGDHLGGIIAPGLHLMRESLLKGTQGIHLRKRYSGQVALLARDTEGGVNGGTLYAVVALIDRVLADVSETLGKNVKYVITGGDAPQILPLLAHDFIYESDLVLQGLALIATEHK
ncbi:MAG: type III pantothenate kinase [Pseudomonadota bacterium]